MLNAVRILKLGGWLGLALIASAGQAAYFADAFADRETLTGETETVLGSNVGTTVEPGEPPHAGKPGGPTYWFSY